MENVYHTKATALELGFTFVADSKTNWVHLSKEDSVQARCNSRYIVHETLDGAGRGYDFECKRCNKIIAKALLAKVGA
jgi:tRNA(Ile2) C34 agmatinyltransferase TiaS